MIGRIHGRLLEISGNLMLVDVGGVAYEVEVTTAALSDGATSGADVTLFTHFVVREDAQQLYGFGSRTERDVFRDLIKINGVGPKLALSILSGLSLDALADAIRAHDVALLTRVPGVGRKTAERLLVELKDRLGELAVVVKPVSVGADARTTREAENALVALGYRPAEAYRAVADVADVAATTEELVRAALKQLLRQVEVSS